MSDQQQESVEEEEEEEDEENEDEQEDEDGENEQEDDEQQQEDDEDEQNQQDEQEEQEEKQQNGNEDTQNNVKLPKFRSIEEPEQFKFSNLIAEISSLSVSVDHFIHTLPSHGGSVYRSYIPPPVYIPPVSRFPIEQKQQIPQKVVIMKDQDIQVSMQPQIIIQPTKIEKQVEKQSYKISNQSTKFLAQLYEQNKKLKRWQNSSHQMNTNAFSEGRMNSANGFYNSREKYERKEYEKGLFNVQERNREIDEAISKLKNSEE